MEEGGSYKLVAEIEEKDEGRTACTTYDLPGCCLQVRVLCSNKYSPSTVQHMATLISTQSSTPKHCTYIYLTNSGFTI